MFITDTNPIFTPTALALGNFDGVHLGHQQVLKPILGYKDLHPTVVTFNPHPREFFTQEQRPLLTPVQEKALILQSLGITQLVTLPFDKQLAQLTAEKFVRLILVDKLGASVVSVGEDFRFGYQRQGGIRELKAIADSYNLEILVTPNQNTSEQNRISSSLIREALQQGDVSTANQMLGRPYSLVGTVVPGKQIGRQLGFPTANLQLSPNKLLPRLGVYTVQVILDHNNTCHKGVMNIGCRPTLSGSNTTVEVHLLSWNGDLYGQTLNIHLLEFLRPERKFSSVQELQQQIATDCVQASL